jgi:hypothetical protein
MPKTPKSTGRKKTPKNTGRKKLPEGVHVGDALDWNAAWEPVVLWAQLPFWLMVENCTLDVDVQGHVYKVDIISSFGELHAHEVCDSKATCVYTGPFPPKLDRKVAKAIKNARLPTLPRKCKTILRIRSRCNSDALAASQETARSRQRDSQYYFVALCEAHIPILNAVIQSYRLATYDYFPFEVSPWDVPIWLVSTSAGFIRSALVPYATWDLKPQIGPIGGNLREYRLIDAGGLQTAISFQPSAGEFELLDARHLMERGDYSGGVRRITTSLEAIVESVVISELRKRHSETETDKILKNTQNNFPERVRQYEKLSGRKLPTELHSEMKTTRSMRHAIVHRAHRITFNDRGVAQRAVDTGRWIFNWFENNPDRQRLREKGLATKSIGRHFAVSLFNAQLTKDGVVVRGQLAWAPPN